MSPSHSRAHRQRSARADRDAAASAADPPLARAPRRYPVAAGAVTLIVLASALFVVSPIRDAVSLAPVPGVRLEHGAGYTIIAPLSDVLDTISLLGVRQHIALIVGLVVCYAAARALRAYLRRGAEPAFDATRRGLRETLAAGIALISLIIVYALAALLPRPMASLSLVPADRLIAVDVHSHTEYSHDGRSGWTPEDVRAWHRDAGYDAAYVSDHRTVEGAERGIANNPEQAGQGTMLLQALETVWSGEHVNILGAGRTYRGITTDDLRDVDERALALASMLPRREPVVVETIPGRLDRMHPAAGIGTAGVRAIELVDGAPRGLDQSRLERMRIVHLADSLDLALVAGTDNHGWGHAAAAWTVMDVPGWRGMTTDSLAMNIERVLRGGRASTLVVERHVAGELGAPNALRLALTLPIVAWRMFTTLGADERVLWIVWAWALTALHRAIASRRRAAR